MSTEFHTQLAAHHDAELSQEAQELVNAPLAKEGDADLVAYAMEVIALIEAKTINVYAPSSLIKEEFYDGLSEAQQDKVDLECLNLCGKVRQMKQLYDQEHHTSYQMELIVRDIFLSKERLEQELGDVLYL